MASTPSRLPIHFQGIEWPVISEPNETLLTCIYACRYAAFAQCNDRYAGLSAAEPLTVIVEDGMLFRNFHGIPFDEELHDFILRVSAASAENEIAVPLDARTGEAQRTA